MLGCVMLSNLYCFGVCELQSAPHDDDSDDSEMPPGLISDTSSDEDFDEDEYRKKKQSTVSSIEAHSKLPESSNDKSTPLGSKASKAQKLAKKKKDAKERAKAKKRQEQEEEDNRRVAEAERRAEEKRRAAAVEEQRVAEEKRRRVEAERTAKEAKLRAFKVVQEKSAIRIQALCRRFCVRRKYGVQLAERMQNWATFTNSWGSVMKILRRKPGDYGAPELFSWFEQKSRFDMVLNSATPDMVVKENDTFISDQQKLFQCVATEEMLENGNGNESNTIDQDIIEPSVKELSLSANEAQHINVINNPYVSSVGDDGQYRAPPVLHVEFTETVMKWLHNADTRYRVMFSNRIERLAQGERSYMLAKRLKGCNNPVFETKLDAGQRILWTHLLRANENPSIIVCYTIVYVICYNMA